MNDQQAFSVRQLDRELNRTVFKNHPLLSDEDWIYQHDQKLWGARVRNLLEELRAEKRASLFEAPVLQRGSYTHSSWSRQR